MCAILATVMFVVTLYCAGVGSPTADVLSRAARRRAHLLVQAVEILPHRFRRGSVNGAEEIVDFAIHIYRRVP